MFYTKKKTKTFYTHKNSARQKTKKTKQMVEIFLDSSKNGLFPNITTTNDVYYKRQLTMYFQCFFVKTVYFLCIQ